MNKPAVLVVDDDESITATVSTFLQAAGYEVAVANDGADALRAVATGSYPLILSDIYIDEVSGLEILKAARSAGAECAVILMTARASVRTTVEAESGGAFDYLAKPFEMRALLEVVERAAAHLTRTPPPAPAEDLEEFGNMVGFTPAMVEVYKKIARYGRTDDTVLVAGETGVGKELVARAIHENSARARCPFVAVDSGAVAGTLWESEIFGSQRGAFTGAERDRPGVVETARGGTVFFDEVGEIPAEFQPKLLRFLQQKEYRPVGAGAPRKADVRVIAATNRNLEAMVREGKFREDLFYRLNVLRVEVPPLRERRADITYLVRKFLDAALAASGKRLWLEPGAVHALQQYSWPGNVRELENAIRRLVAESVPGPVTAEDVHDLLERASESGSEDEQEPKQLDELERRQILRVLEETGGNKTRAAEILGIQRRTLYKKLARMAREANGHTAGTE